MFDWNNLDCKYLYQSNLNCRDTILTQVEAGCFIEIKVSYTTENFQKGLEINLYKIQVYSYYLAGKIVFETLVEAGLHVDLDAGSTIVTLKNYF